MRPGGLQRGQGCGREGLQAGVSRGSAASRRCPGPLPPPPWGPGGGTCGVHRALSHRERLRWRSPSSPITGPSRTQLAQSGCAGRPLPSPSGLGDPNRGPTSRRTQQPQAPAQRHGGSGCPAPASQEPLCASLPSLCTGLANHQRHQNPCLRAHREALVNGPCTRRERARFAILLKTLNTRPQSCAAQAQASRRGIPEDTCWTEKR